MKKWLQKILFFDAPAQGMFFALTFYRATFLSCHSFFTLCKLVHPKRLSYKTLVLSHTRLSRGNDFSPAPPFFTIWRPTHGRVIVLLLPRRPLWGLTCPPFPKKLPPFGHGPRVPPLAGFGYFSGTPLSGLPCGFAVLRPASKVFFLICGGQLFTACGGLRQRAFAALRSTASHVCHIFRPRRTVGAAPAQSGLLRISFKQRLIFVVLLLYYPV